MIAHLKGALFKKSTQTLIVDNRGVGYEVIVPLSTFYSLPEESDEVSLHIFTHVREDALSLFGFRTMLEKQIFLLLISVNGIGPKLGINILSGIGPDELVQAIAMSDKLRLQSIPGVGKKMADRIALELKDKVADIGVELPAEPTRDLVTVREGFRDDALSALVNLGYPTKSAKGAIEKALGHVKDDDLEALIKESLNMLRK